MYCLGLKGMKLPKEGTCTVKKFLTQLHAKNIEGMPEDQAFIRFFEDVKEEAFPKGKGTKTHNICVDNWGMLYKILNECITHPQGVNAITVYEDSDEEEEEEGKKPNLKVSSVITSVLYSVKTNILTNMYKLLYIFNYQIANNDIPIEEDVDLGMDEDEYDSLFHKTPQKLGNE